MQTQAWNPAFVLTEAKVPWTRHDGNIIITVLPPLNTFFAFLFLVLELFLFFTVRNVQRSQIHDYF